MMASGNLVGTGLSILDESNGVTRATFIGNIALTPPLLNNKKPMEALPLAFCLEP